MEHSINHTPRFQLDKLVKEHGIWAILQAAISLVFVRTKPRPQPQDLSAHLQRDIGLEYVPPSPTYRDFL